MELELAAAFEWYDDRLVSFETESSILAFVEQATLKDGRRPTGSRDDDQTSRTRATLKSFKNKSWFYSVQV